jgi:competence protein ComEC
LHRRGTDDQRTRLTVARTAPQPFIGLVIMAVLGILAADSLSLPSGASVPVAVVFLLTALVVFRTARVSATYGLVGLGFFLLHSFENQNTPGLVLADQLGDRPRAINATGCVLDEPKVAPNGFATFLFKLEQVELEGRILPTKATLLVRWRGEPKFGNEYNLFGIAEPIAPARNPGEFQMRSYLARRDVRRALFVRYPEDGLLLRHRGGDPILRAAQHSRAWMQKVLCQSLEDAPDVQSLLDGVVLGLRHQTQNDIEEPFQQTGTLHLFSVAGLHVGIVAQLLWILAAVGRVSRKWATGLIIPLLFFYAAVTGLHVSSVRAAVMSSVLLGGFFFDRKVFSLNSLAVAAFFLLSWNTNELFSIGFQLSFAVVGTIILLADPLFFLFRRFVATDAFLPRTLLSRARRVSGATLEWICRGASVSLAAWLGSLPLILWSFHLITPVSLVANLAVVPLAFFILAIALLSLLTAPVLSWVSIVFNNANWFLAQLVLALVHWFAEFPGGHFYVPQLQWLEPKDAQITVLDVGAGAAVHLRTSAVDWLLDCGSERDYDRVLREYLHAAGANRVDGLVLSHGDSLHIGGSLPLLQDFLPRLVIDNPAADRSLVHRRLRQVFADRHIHPVNPSAGDDFEISPEVVAKVLFPLPGYQPAAVADDEALVMQLVIGRATKVLLVSDSGSATENALLVSDADLRSDILVKGQHHSGKSGTERFLDAVRPRLIIATSRDFPEYERIPDEWVNAVRDKGIKLFRQDETGAVAISFREGEWKAQAYITGETFRSANR